MQHGITCMKYLESNLYDVVSEVPPAEIEVVEEVVLVLIEQEVAQGHKWVPMARLIQGKCIEVPAVHPLHSTSTHEYEIIYI